MERAIRIGVTGKIGSGKSTLLRLMESRGIAVINTDQLARTWMEEDKILRNGITQLLGAESYQEGKLNRSFIASKIFQDAALRSELEAMVHPAVSREVEAVFRQSPPGKLVAVESALILQTDFWRLFDYIVLVDTPDDVVIARLEGSSRFSAEEVKLRLQEQHWEQIPAGEVDFTIDNSGTPAEFEARCKSVIGLMEVLAMRPLPAVPLYSVEAAEE